MEPTQTRVPYDRATLTIGGLRGESIGTLIPENQHAAPPAKQLIAAALGNPIGSKRLAEIAVGKGSAVILIPGKTRVAGVSDFIPLLIDELNEGGIGDDSITLILATGTHERHVENDLAELLGESTVARVNCVGHDCRDEDNLVSLGTTSRGTPVRLSRRVVEADIKVLTGRIVPHYFAGFSGGRKALLPGVAGFDSILANHSLTLADDNGIHPAVNTTQLDHNPVHLDMVEAASLAHPDFCFNTLLDTGHRLVDAVAGDSIAAHQEGCRRALQLHQCRVASSVDAVITSAGGAPYDCNFIQSIKAALNVQEILRPGGCMLWIARAAGGIPPAFLQWCEIEAGGLLNRAVRRDYNLAGHNTIMLRQLTGRAKIALLSDLPATTVEKLGLFPVDSLDQGVRWLNGQLDDSSRYAVVPFANVTHATLHP